MKAEYSPCITGLLIFDREDVVPGRQIAHLDPHGLFTPEEQEDLARLIVQALNQTNSLPSL